MAYERKDLELNGGKYSILPPAVTDGIKLALRTTTLLGGLISVLGEEASSTESAFDRFGSALLKVDPDRAQLLLMDAVLASKLHYNSEPIFKVDSFTVHFNDKRSEVFQVMAWCLWEGIKDFLPQQLLSMLKGAMPVTAFQSQTTGQ